MAQTQADEVPTQEKPTGPINPDTATIVPKEDVVVAPSRFSQEQTSVEPLTPVEDTEDNTSTRVVDNESEETYLSNNVLEMLHDITSVVKELAGHEHPMKNRFNEILDNLNDMIEDNDDV